MTIESFISNQCVVKNNETVQQQISDKFLAFLVFGNPYSYLYYNDVISKQRRHNFFMYAVSLILLSPSHLFLDGSKKCYFYSYKSPSFWCSQHQVYLSYLKARLYDRPIESRRQLFVFGIYQLYFLCLKTPYRK